MDVVASAEGRGKPVSILSGIMITAGSAIGAGMFSLPTVASGMWFAWSIACMLLSWFCMYHASLMILEVNLNFKEGESFDTLVKETLGKKASVVNGLLLVFILYILNYAYISAGGSMVNHTLESTLGFAPPQIISGLFFVLVLAVAVWMSTKTVDRVITILVCGMALTFFMAVADLSVAATVNNLFSDAESSPKFYFVFAALPYFLTSFGFYTMVPSLVKYYGKKPQIISKSMLIGSLICFAIYLLWLFSTMGNLAREQFLPIVADGGNVGVLVKAINQVVSSDGLGKLLNIFVNMAVVSSFLGVSLGLFDFIADKFRFEDDAMGRLKTALVVFVPPSIGGLIFPHGYIYAIGFAGLALAINGLIIPALMLQKSRREFAGGAYRVRGGNALVYFLIVMGLFYATCHVLAMMSLLPVYGR